MTTAKSAKRSAECACGVRDSGVGEPSRAARRSARDASVGVDPAIKERSLTRLRRVEGQVRGLQRMVDEDRCCAEVMTQIAAAQEALRGVGREIMRNHLRHCASTAADASTDDAGALYDDALDLLYKSAR